MKGFAAICVAAVQSGVGKTTLTIGLLAALKRRGLAVQPFKCGPDYIDAGHHGRACGRISRCLDSWMMGADAVRGSFCKNVSDADVAVIEGVMGLFDGAESDVTYGTTAHVSVITGSPVLLLINGKGLAQSAAAMVKGFCELRKDVRIAGVVANNVNSVRHRKMIEDSLKAEGLPPLLGVIPREAGIAIPERHLGLVPGSETFLDDAWYGKLADIIEQNIDLDSVLRIFSRERPAVPESAASESLNTVRIGIARDEAFHFYYEDNLDMLRSAGAELVEFSPIHDSALPGGISGLYIGGGFPEMFSRKLNDNAAMRREIHKFAGNGGKIYAECGGLMYLCRDLIDGNDVRLDMCGVVPASTVMENKMRQLGYRLAVQASDGPFGRQGAEVRGHEFHWSRADKASSNIDPAYVLQDSKGCSLGQEGFFSKNVFASYVHVHFASNPEAVKHFVNWMRGA